MKLDSCPLSRTWALNLPHNLLDMCAQQMLKSKADRDNDQLPLTTVTTISVVIATAFNDGQAVSGFSTGYAAFTRSLSFRD